MKFRQGFRGYVQFKNDGVSAAINWIVMTNYPCLVNRILLTDLYCGLLAP